MGSKFSVGDVDQIKNISPVTLLTKALALVLNVDTAATK